MKRTILISLLTFAPSLWAKVTTYLPKHSLNTNFSAGLTNMEVAGSGFAPVGEYFGGTLKAELEYQYEVLPGFYTGLGGFTSGMMGGGNNEEGYKSEVKGDYIEYSSYRTEDKISLMTYGFHILGRARLSDMTTLHSRLKYVINRLSPNGTTMTKTEVDQMSLPCLSRDESMINAINAQASSGRLTEGFRFKTSLFGQVCSLTMTRDY